MGKLVKRRRKWRKGKKESYDGKNERNDRKKKVDGDLKIVDEINYGLNRKKNWWKKRNLKIYDRNYGIYGNDRKIMGNNWKSRINRKKDKEDR